MMGDILESIGIPLIPLGSIDILNNSFCYIVSGFCHIFLRNNTINKRSFLMEAGPGSLVPSFGALHHSNNIIEVEVLGECKIRAIKPQTLLSISKSRKAFFSDFTETLGQIHMRSMSFQQILSVRPKSRFATTIFNYSNNPFWQPDSELISLPPCPILARILHISEKELLSQISTLIHTCAIESARTDTTSDHRLNFIIINEHTLVRALDDIDRTFCNIMTIGNNLDSFTAKLMKLITVRRTHFRCAEDAIRAIKTSPDRFDLILAGHCPGTSPYIAFCHEIERGTPEILKILPRLVLEASEADSRIFNRISGNQNCILSFNKEGDYHNMIDIVFKRLSLLASKSQTNTNIVPLSVYQGAHLQQKNSPVKQKNI